MNPKQRCQTLCEELGLTQGAVIDQCEPLTGGVASDIYRLEVAGKVYCAKFALEKLKVAADWHAPVHRNQAEFAWLQVAAQMVPETAVKLFGHSALHQGFVMEFVPSEQGYLWKQALLVGQSNGTESPAVAEVIGRIHAMSSRPDFDASPFQNHSDFYDLRIEPYLVYTASQKPQVGDALLSLAENLRLSNKALVHGDVSPKNIIFRRQGPILLDAECATMGDPVFDVAFCLNHLLIKALHLPAKRNALLKSAMSFWQRYRQHIEWEEVGTFEVRLCRLLPALMLARVAGKSPVEYLEKDNQSVLSRAAVKLIESEPKRLEQLLADYQAKTETNR